MENINGMYSIKEIYRTGRGPSSSHTMGPSFACERALSEAIGAEHFEVRLFGSLAKTGKDHRTDYAIEKTFGDIPVEIKFDLEWENLPHPNTMEISSFKGNEQIYRKTFLSVGGGAIHELGAAYEEAKIVYKEKNFYEIEEYCAENGLSLPEYVEKYEGTEIRGFARRVIQQMKETVSCGLAREGIIPGGLNIKRKAKMLLEKRSLKGIRSRKGNIYAFGICLCGKREKRVRRNDGDCADLRRVRSFARGAGL